MDFFGIGKQIKNSMYEIISSMRQSGKTTEMLEMLKDGDRVCFTNVREKNRVQRLCRELNIDVNCIVIPISRVSELATLGRSSKGRTIFDHSWIEDYYTQAIEIAGDNIDKWESRSLAKKELNW